MAWIKGNSYNNNLYGTNYNDIIEGFGGHDVLFGYAGNDDLYGGSGDDDLYGGAGHDDLYGGTGWDYMVGGTGDDHYFVDSYYDELVEYAGEGRDAVFTGTSSWTLGANFEDLAYTGYGNFRGTGNGLANMIEGGDYADTLQGLTGDDTLYGYGGDDTLVGGAGRDLVHGGAGHDWIFGGSGNDTLTGGSGYDDFHFDSALSATTNVDHITDFTIGVDAIFLNRDIFTGIGADGRLSAAAYTEGLRARDSSDRIIYDQAAGKIFYDPDGTGAAAQILFATVTPGTNLEAVDFYGY